MIVDRFKTPFAYDNNLYECFKCKELKDRTCFTGSSRNIHRGCLQSYCKECMLAYGRQHRKDNTERYRQRSRDRYKSSFEARLKYLLAVSSSDRSNLDYDWCWNKLISQDFKCEITGIPLSFEVRQPSSMSIDRIDSSKGYTKDNVRFVCWWINAAMGNWGLERLESFIKEWNDYKQIQNSVR